MIREGVSGYRMQDCMWDYYVPQSFACVSLRWRHNVYGTSTIMLNRTGIISYGTNRTWDQSGGFSMTSSLSFVTQAGGVYLDNQPKQV